MEELVGMRKEGNEREVGVVERWSRIL